MAKRGSIASRAAGAGVEKARNVLGMARSSSQCIQSKNKGDVSSSSDPDSLKNLTRKCFPTQARQGVQRDGLLDI